MACSEMSAMPSLPCISVEASKQNSSTKDNSSKIAEPPKKPDFLSASNSPKSKSPSGNCICEDKNREQLLIHQLLERKGVGKSGWICISKDCGFVCEPSHTMMLHCGQKEHGTVGLNAVQYEEVIDVGSLLLSIPTEDKKNEGEPVRIPDSWRDNGNRALLVKCFCGKEQLALVLAELEEHERKALEPKPVKKHIKSKGKMRKLRRKLAETPMKCKLCPRVLILQHSCRMFSHALTHVEKAWKCVKCNKTRQREHDLKRHYLEMHKSDDCDKMMEKSLSAIDPEEYNKQLNEMAIQCFPKAYPAFSSDFNRNDSSFHIRGSAVVVPRINLGRPKTVPKIKSRSNLNKNLLKKQLGRPPAKRGILKERLEKAMDELKIERNWASIDQEDKPLPTEVKAAETVIVRKTRKISTPRGRPSSRSRKLWVLGDEFFATVDEIRNRNLPEMAKCKLCKKALKMMHSSFKYNLGSHCLTHMPHFWQCSVCPQTSSRPDNIKVHIESKHSSKANIVMLGSQNDLEEGIAKMITVCFPAYDKVYPPVKSEFSPARSRSSSGRASHNRSEESTSALSSKSPQGSTNQIGDNQSSESILPKCKTPETIVPKTEPDVISDGKTTLRKKVEKALRKEAKKGWRKTVEKALGTDERREIASEETGCVKDKPVESVKRVSTVNYKSKEPGDLDASCDNIPESEEGSIGEALGNAKIKKGQKKSLSSKPQKFPSDVPNAGPNGASFSDLYSENVGRCNICDSNVVVSQSLARCRNLEKLKTHAKLHMEKMYQCVFCEHRARTKDNLMKHMNHVHKRAGEPKYLVPESEIKLQILEVSKKAFPLFFGAEISAQKVVEKSEDSIEPSDISVYEFKETNTGSQDSLTPAKYSSPSKPKSLPKSPKVDDIFSSIHQNLFDNPKYSFKNLAVKLTKDKSEKSVNVVMNVPITPPDTVASTAAEMSDNSLLNSSLEPGNLRLGPDPPTSVETSKTDSSILNEETSGFLENSALSSPSEVWPDNPGSNGTVSNDDTASVRSSTDCQEEGKCTVSKKSRIRKSKELDESCRRAMRCRICNVERTFKVLNQGYVSMKSHSELHLEIPPHWKCRLCDYTTRNRVSVYKHVEINHGKDVQDKAPILNLDKDEFSRLLNEKFRYCFPDFFDKFFDNSTDGSSGGNLSLRGAESDDRNPMDSLPLPSDGPDGSPAVKKKRKNRKANEEAVVSAVSTAQQASVVSNFGGAIFNPTTNQTGSDFGPINPEAGSTAFNHNTSTLPVSNQGTNAQIGNFINSNLAQNHVDQYGAANLQNPQGQYGSMTTGLPQYPAQYTQNQPVVNAVTFPQSYMPVTVGTWNSQQSAQQNHGHFTSALSSYAENDNSAMYATLNEYAGQASNGMEALCLAAEASSRSEYPSEHYFTPTSVGQEIASTPEIGVPTIPIYFASPTGSRAPQAVAMATSGFAEGKTDGDEKGSLLAFSNVSEAAKDTRKSWGEKAAQRSEIKLNRSIILARKGDKVDCSLCSSTLKLHTNLTKACTSAGTELRYHAMSHISSNFQCCFCDKRTTRKSDCVNHMKSHSAYSPESHQPQWILGEEEFKKAVNNKIVECFPYLGIEF